ncbi:MAG: nuclear transport factor 2 family protein [Byssovorax sp.]
MRTLIVLSCLMLSACTATAIDSAPAGEGEALAPLQQDDHAAHSSAPPGICGHAPASIAQAFADFDDATSPPAAQPAEMVLASWLAHLDPDVVFISGNAPPLVGRAAVASYFGALLPVIGTVVHDLETVSPVCGEESAWSVRGTLLLTRRSDGQAVSPIPFTDTLFFNEQGLIRRYEIRFDPTPLGQLFAP